MQMQDVNNWGNWVGISRREQVEGGEKGVFGLFWKIRSIHFKIHFDEAV